MARSKEQFVQDVMSGEARGAGPAMLRFLLASAEPGYAGIMRVRNACYDAGWFGAHRLDRPVVSVGNITAGGTGKTPVVAWLVKRLMEVGRHPAVLMRGYKSIDGVSDEQALLAEAAATVVHAEGDRVAGGRKVIAEHPEVDVLVMDDGFQHRRLARDFDLVLLDATNPFGWNHVHPRGLLREPMRGLGRADAFLITRVDQASDAQRTALEQTIRRFNAVAPIFAARHAHLGFRAADDLPLSARGGRRFFAVAGIGNPRSLDVQLRQLPGEYAGHCWVGDHHAYTPGDLDEIRRQALAVNADTLLVTEKDWVKIRRLDVSGLGLPVWRLSLGIVFEGDHGDALLRAIQASINP